MTADERAYHAGLAAAYRQVSARLRVLLNLKKRIDKSAIRGLAQRTSDQADWHKEKSET